MALIKANFPWTDLSDFFDDKWLKTRFPNGEWTPAVNVIDNENNYEIEVAAPGIKKEDFKVTVEKGLLTISGQTESETEEKKKNYTRKEFSSKSFTRSFTIPENIKDEDVNAKYDHGVLKLTLKKSVLEAPKKKEISIN
ncbi:MAG: Hsp20/alpha crystallin family protein [Bacteroidota bacterium]|nr:Hsp20/alpha crystallin family protein [Bacteroidota bacterium]